jgi:hypothetical protein
MRFPIGYNEQYSERSKKKWNKIIPLFFEDKLNELIENQRTGTRGRILSVLASKIFNILEIPYKTEPVFNHMEPNNWYKEFAIKYDIKLRTHNFYNPDFLLEDGTWVEVTLSENTAYKKIFRYGHQTVSLLLLWLDEDEGYHKEICRSVRFPNVQFECIEFFNEQICRLQEGVKIIDQLKTLKELKKTIL